MIIFKRKIKLFTPIILSAMLSCNSSTDEISVDKIYRDTLNADILEYKLTKDSLLTDTLKIYTKGYSDPSVFQIWDNGVLLSEHAIDKKGSWHKLTFKKTERERIGRPVELTIAYIDEDSVFYAPYNKEIFAFFDRHKILSTREISNQDTSFFQIYNVPHENYMLLTTDTTMFFHPYQKGIKAITKRKERDTLFFFTVYHSYNFRKIEFPDFWMIATNK